MSARGLEVDLHFGRVLGDLEPPTLRGDDAADVRRAPSAERQDLTAGAGEGLDIGARPR